MHPYWPQLYGFLLVDKFTESYHVEGKSRRHGEDPPPMPGNAAAPAPTTSTYPGGPRAQDGTGHVNKAMTLASLSAPGSSEALSQLDRLDDHMLRLVLEGLNALVSLGFSILRVRHVWGPLPNL